MDPSTITIHRNGRPIYLQVSDYLESSIASGVLQPGERLPSARELARALSISRNTATNAYHELEARGLVRGQVGRGTFVCASPDDAGNPFSWRGKVSVSALRTGDPSLRWLTRSASDTRMISFAPAVSARECFPVERLQKAIDRVVERFGSHAIALAPTEGHQALRQAIATRTRVPLQEVLVLSGAQQGIDLIARCLLDVGDTVVIDRPGYLGAIQTFRSSGANLVGWDVEGWDLDALEHLLVRYRPKFLYTNPTFQNPTGQTMTVSTRRELLKLAVRYRLPIIEDEPYRELGFNKTPPPTLFELDEHNLVIHIGTFSKTLAGGLRLGWMLASGDVLDQLTLIKQRSDVSTVTLVQLLVSEFLRSGAFDAHVETLRTEHHRRYTALKNALGHHIGPRRLAFCPVHGGLYVWCTLRVDIDSHDLLHAAESRGVSFVHGAAFYPQNGGSRQFRLSFSSATVDLIDEGIRRIAPLLVAG